MLDVFHDRLLNYLFRHAGVIPICSAKQCEKTYNQAFESVHQALNNEELVCVFPEGRLFPDGNIGEFRPGINKILQRDPVSVVPMALQGLWDRTSVIKTDMRSPRSQSVSGQRSGVRLSKRDKREICYVSM